MNPLQVAAAEVARDDPHQLTALLLARDNALGK